jgi:hypothetical protein
VCQVVKNGVVQDVSERELKQHRGDLWDALLEQAFTTFLIFVSACRSQCFTLSL